MKSIKKHMRIKWTLPLLVLSVMVSCLFSHLICNIISLYIENMF